MKINKSLAIFLLMWIVFGIVKLLDGSVWIVSTTFIIGLSYIAYDMLKKKS